MNTSELCHNVICLCIDFEYHRPQLKNLCVNCGKGPNLKLGIDRALLINLMLSGGWGVVFEILNYYLMLYFALEISSPIIGIYPNAILYLDELHCGFSISC